ncbi:hypothetical protein MF627_003235 [Paenibacillus polymyxa]|nr:hypothetical protein [Paenibacillus polymyxa]URJ38779.1 hypothetical protein MF627_003235 [Paenibacillus polymyxa]
MGLALSSILVLAGSSESLYQGIGQLAVYTLGLGISILAHFAACYFLSIDG